jgi:hypothetical protein
MPEHASIRVRDVMKQGFAALIEGTAPRRD